MPSKTIDNQNFVDVGALEGVRQIIWQGLPGKYLAVTLNGLFSTVDYGGTWGSLRPNNTFGTLWPAGALGYQVAFAVGPNECPPPATCLDLIRGGFSITAASSSQGAGAIPSGWSLMSIEQNGGNEGQIFTLRKDDIDATRIYAQIASHDNAVTSLSIADASTESEEHPVLISVFSEQATGIPDIPGLTSEKITQMEMVETIEFDSNSRLTVFKGIHDGTGGAGNLVIELGLTQVQIIAEMYVLPNVPNTTDPISDAVSVATTGYSHTVDYFDDDFDHIVTSDPPSDVDAGSQIATIGLILNTCFGFPAGEGFGTPFTSADIEAQIFEDGVVYLFRSGSAGIPAPPMPPTPVVNDMALITIGSEVILSSGATTISRGQFYLTYKTGASPSITLDPSDTSSGFIAVSGCHPTLPLNSETQDVDNSTIAMALAAAGKMMICANVGLGVAGTPYGAQVLGTTYLWELDGSPSFGWGGLSGERHAVAVLLNPEP